MNLQTFQNETITLWWSLPHDKITRELFMFCIIQTHTSITADPSGFEFGLKLPRVVSRVVPQTLLRIPPTLPSHTPTLPFVPLHNTPTTIPPSPRTLTCTAYPQYYFIDYNFSLYTLGFRTTQLLQTLVLRREPSICFTEAVYAADICGTSDLVYSNKLPHYLGVANQLR